MESSLMSGATDRPFRRQFSLRVADRTRLMVNIAGVEDGPGVVLCDGLACDGFAWRYLRPKLQDRFRVLHFHYRGHGRSGLPPNIEDCTLPHLVRDIDELMERTGQPQSMFIGHSMGVQVILEMALRYEHRVRAGILLCGPYGRALTTFKHTDIGLKLLPRVREFVSRHRERVRSAMSTFLPTSVAYQFAVMTELNRDLMKQKDFMAYLDGASKMPPDLLVALVTDVAERTSEHFMGRVRQPMLVVAGENDGVTPPFTATFMHQALPASDYELIIAGSHAAPVERPNVVNDMVTRFIARHELATQATETSVAPTLAERFRAAAR
jgi:pimeloyl-ACP methyl ester carboxylesterase